MQQPERSNAAAGREGNSLPDGNSMPDGAGKESLPELKE